MESPESFRRRFGQARVLWQTRLGGYCLGLDEFVPIALVPTLDDGLDFDAIEHQLGIRFFSLERSTGRRGVLDDRGIDLLIPTVEPDLAAGLADSPAGRWIALSPYPGDALPKFAAKAGMRCRSIGWETFFRFSSKAHLLAGLAELGLPRLPGSWLSLNRSRFTELASRFGHRFVAQLDVGAAGFGTAIVESEDEFAAAVARFGDAAVWVTPFAGSLSLNVNAIATGRGTAVGYPSVQVVDQKALKSSRGGHCGNDFSATAAVPRSLVASVREQTARIGEWMASRGYRGLFGLDFVVDDASQQAYAVDLNPRWQGSTALQSQAERRLGRIPLAAVEAAYTLGFMDDDEVMGMSDSFFESIEGSQLFPKNGSLGDWVVRGGLEAGIHTPDLAFLRSGLRLHDLDSPASPAPPASPASPASPGSTRPASGVAAPVPEEVLLSCGIPPRGRVLAAGVTLLRVTSLRAAVDPRSARVLPWVADTTRALYDALALERIR